LKKHPSKWTIGTSITSDDFRYSKGEKSSLAIQISADRHMGDYLILGAYLGHQNRDYSFRSEYPLDPFTVKTIYYQRTFIPIGIRFGLNLTSFFSNQLNWVNKEEKWEILILGYGGLTVSSEKIKTPINSGEAIEWSDYQSQEDMNYIAGVNAIIRYFPTEKWGIQTEMGYGPVGRVSVGVSYRIF
jgi:hypothetical protein